jgi:hypothetical protein
MQAVQFGRRGRGGYSVHRFLRTINREQLGLEMMLLPFHLREFDRRSMEFQNVQLRQKQAAQFGRRGRGYSVNRFLRTINRDHAALGGCRGGRSGSTSGTSWGIFSLALRAQRRSSRKIRIDHFLSCSFWGMQLRAFTTFHAGCATPRVY